LKRYQKHLQRKRFYYWAGYAWIYLCSIVCMIVAGGEYRFVGEGSLFINTFSFFTTCFVFLFPFSVFRFRPKKEISFYPEMNLKMETVEMKRVLEELMGDLEVDPDSIQIHCVHSDMLALARPWQKLIRLGKGFFKQSRVVQRYIFLHEYAHVQQEDRVFQLSSYAIPSFLMLMMNLSFGFVLFGSWCCGLVGYLLYCSWSVQKEYAADAYAVEFLSRKGLVTKLQMKILKIDYLSFGFLLLWSLCCLFAIFSLSYFLWVKELLVCAPFIILAFLKIAKMSHPFYKRRNRAIEQSIQEGLANRT